MRENLGDVATAYGDGKTTATSFHVAFDYTNFFVNWLASHLALLFVARYGWPDLSRHLRSIDDQCQIDPAHRLLIRRLVVSSILGVVVLVNRKKGFPFSNVPEMTLL